MSSTARHAPAARWPGTAAFLAAAAVVVVAGLALRIAGAQGDLWLDEIWSLDLLARRAPTPWHVFWSVQHANSHPLYALYLWFVGPAPAPLIARLPAVVLGAASIVVAGLIGARNSRAEALSLMLLVALSYPLVHYGSEARGYGPMLFCALLAFHLVDRDLAEGAARRRHGVAAALAAGFLFHLTAALVVAALWLWVAARGYGETGSLAAAHRRARRYFGPIMAAFVAILVLFSAGLAVNGYTIGGNAPTESFAARFVAEVGRMSALLFGLPGGVPAGAALAGLVAATVAALVWLRARGDGRWPFYAVAVLALPGLLFAIGHPPPAFGRYYLFGLVFVLPLAAQVLARLWQAGGGPRLAAVAALAAFAVASLRLDALFLEHGRGEYRAAIRLMADAVHGSTVRVGSDHDFRQRTVLAYHLPYAAAGETLDYVPWDELARRPPDWFIVHRGAGEADSPRAPTAFALKGSTWAFAVAFRRWGLSGFDWLLYRRVPPA